MECIKLGSARNAILLLVAIACFQYIKVADLLPVLHCSNARIRLIDGKNFSALREKLEWMRSCASTE